MEVIDRPRATLGASISCECSRVRVAHCDSVKKEVHELGRRAWTCHDLFSFVLAEPCHDLYFVAEVEPPDEAWVSRMVNPMVYAMLNPQPEPPGPPEFRVKVIIEATAPSAK